MTIVRWDPFRDFGFGSGAPTWVPPVDIYQNGDQELEQVSLQLANLTFDARVFGKILHSSSNLCLFEYRDGIEWL